MGQRSAVKKVIKVTVTIVKTVAHQIDGGKCGSCCF